MSEIFGNESNSRGCFFAYRNVGSAGRGAVLKMKGGMLPAESATEPLLVTGFSYVQQESVAFMKVFGDRVYAYAFGHDPGPSVLTVTYAGFLVNKQNYSGVVGKVNGQYKENRVYENQQYVKLGLGTSSSNVLSGFVLGMSSSTLDPQHSLQSFQIVIGLVEVQG